MDKEITHPLIIKPQSTRPGSSLFPMEGLLGVPEGSRAQRCPGSGPLPVSRVSATHPNPAWHPKQPSLVAPGSSNPAPEPSFQAVTRSTGQTNGITSHVYSRQPTI
jgi:hypothetical protein